MSDFTFTFHALEKEMATHSSVLAWRVPGTGEPGGLPSMGSHRIGHDWSDLAAAAGSSMFVPHSRLWGPWGWEMDLVCHDKPGSSSLALNKICVCVCVCVCSVESDSVIPWTVARQAPLSIEFSRQEYWRVGCHFLLQGIFPTQESNPGIL